MEYSIGTIGKAMPQLFIIEERGNSLIYHASQEANDLRFPTINEAVYPYPWVVARLKGYLGSMNEHETKKAIMRLFEAQSMNYTGYAKIECDRLVVSGKHQYPFFQTTPRELLINFKDQLDAAYREICSFKSLEILGT